MNVSIFTLRSKSPSVGGIVVVDGGEESFFFFFSSSLGSAYMSVRF